MDSKSSRTKNILQLFLSFFKIGIVTFGGGLTMLPLLEAEIVDKKKWATRDDLLDYYAIGQVTPGIIAVNVATFVGYKKERILGGISATLGMVAPSILIITFIAMFLSNFTENPIVQKAFMGINIAVSALLIHVSWSFAKKALLKWYHVLIAIVVFTAVFIFNVHTAWIILSVFTLGLIIHGVKIVTSKDKK